MKHSVLLRTLLLAAWTLALVGCSVSNSEAVGANAAAKASAKPLPAREGAVFANQLAEGPGARIRIVRLKVWQLVIPLGAISRSEEFWKHVDEQRVDVGTYDLLRKNGWRLGIAPTAEWETYFRDIVDAYPASSTRSEIYTGPTGGNGVMELPMKQSVPYQNIFYFTDDNSLYGRTYEECANLLNIKIQQAPRKVREARVTVCPMVRSLRKRFEVSKKNEEREIRYVHSERLYDLNLQVDLPIHHFLVIAPSPEVKWKTSLGATFLVQDEAAEQLEQVLLLVPSEEDLKETIPTPSRAPAR
jgi:hypothetical protein